MTNPSVEKFIESVKDIHSKIIHAAMKNTYGETILGCDLKEFLNSPSVQPIIGSLEFRIVAGKDKVVPTVQPTATKKPAQTGRGLLREQQILEALAKRAMTAADLGKKLKYTSKSGIYPHLYSLKSKRKITQNSGGKYCLRK